MSVQVTDISTFTDDKKRAEVDAWQYDTCTQCLQHIIDITVKFYPVVQPLLGRVLELLLNFIRLALTSKGSRRAHGAADPQFAWKVPVRGVLISRLP